MDIKIQNGGKKMSLEKGIDYFETYNKGVELGKRMKFKRVDFLPIVGAFTYHSRGQNTIKNFIKENGLEEIGQGAYNGFTMGNMPQQFVHGVYQIFVSIPLTVPSLMIIIDKIYNIVP